MEVKARLSNLRSAPRKVRLVADLIRGKKVAVAQSILTFTVNQAARPMLNLLNSAVASAKNNFHLNETDLTVLRVMVDEGPKMKRSHPMSRGRAFPILKRTSHIVIILSDMIPTTTETKESEAKTEIKKETKKTTVKKEKTVKKPRKTTSKKS